MQTHVAPETLAERTQQLVELTRGLANRGFTPATSGNFSHRIDAECALITTSGRDKGALLASDFMLVDMKGTPVNSDAKPSAETLLHVHLYRRLPYIDCILHTHSQAQTVASRLFAGAGRIAFSGYELIKAIADNTTHDASLVLPVLPNSQDMTTLAAQVEALLDAGPLWGYLIDGHGLYTWGRSLGEARRHLDAFEFLLACELETIRLAGARSNR